MKPSLKPYMVVDLETTGLDISKSGILELALVMDDGYSPIEHLPKLELIINSGAITYGEPYALWMNSALLEKIAKFDPSVVTLEAAKGKYYNFIEEMKHRYGQGYRLTISGKNSAGFDVPLLKSNGFDTSMFKHRIGDVGSLYWTDFGYVPSLEEINKLIGNNDKVAHRALSDCYDVIKAVRAKFGVK